MTTRNETITHKGKTYSVTLDSRGYRTRIWTREFGYTGSYFPAAMKVRTCGFEADALGPLTAVRALIDHHNR